MTQALPDAPSHRFEGTPFGPLLLDRDCIFYYDEPLLYLGQAADGTVWLCELLDTDDRSRRDETMAIELTSEEAAFWRSRSARLDLVEPLSRLFEGERTRWIVVETWDEDAVVRIAECRPATPAEVADAAPRR